MTLPNLSSCSHPSPFDLSHFIIFSITLSMWTTLFLHVIKSFECKSKIRLIFEYSWHYLYRIRSWYYNLGHHVTWSVIKLIMVEIFHRYTFFSTYLKRKIIGKFFDIYRLSSDGTLYRNNQGNIALHETLKFIKYWSTYSVLFGLANRSDIYFNIGLNWTGSVYTKSWIISFQVVAFCCVQCRALNYLRFIPIQWHCNIGSDQR